MAFAAFLIYLVCLLVRPQEFVPALMGMPIIRFALIAAACALLFQNHKRFDGPPTWFLLFFVPAAFLSWASNGWIGGGVIAAERLLTTAILPYFIVANVVDSHNKQILVMWVLVIVSLVMVSNGLSQVAAPDGIGWAGIAYQDGGRIAYLGIFNDPNDLCMFLVMSLPLAVFLAQRSGFVLRIGLYGAAAAIIYGAYLTNSRGGLLALLGLIAFWFWLKYGMMKSAIFGAFTLPIAFLAMSYFRAIDPDESSANDRLDAWYEGFQMLISRPVFGTGFDSFLDHFFITAHNSLVLVFSELGLVGYFFWGGFVFFCTVALLVTWREGIRGSVAETVDPDEKAVARALTFSFLGFGITGFFLSRSYSPLLYLYCGMVMATFYRTVPAIVAARFFKFRTYAGPFALAYFGSFVVIYVMIKLFI